MSKKGIRYCVFGVLQETDTTNTYSGGKYISPVVAFNGTHNTADAQDYGDDRLVESDNSVTGGTLNLELNNDEDDIYTMLLGHTKSQEGEVSYKDSDEAPYVGCGAYGKSGSKWKAKFYTKVKFKEPADENQTKEQNVTYGHVNVEGDIYVPKNGEWKKTENFDDEASAKAWLNELVGITTTPATTH